MKRAKSTGVQAGKKAGTGKRSTTARPASASAAKKGKRATAARSRGKEAEPGPEMKLAGGPGIRDGRGSNNLA